MKSAPDFDILFNRDAIQDLIKKHDGLLINPTILEYKYLYDIGYKKKTWCYGINPTRMSLKIFLLFAFIELLLYATIIVVISIDTGYPNEIVWIRNGRISA